MVFVYEKRRSSNADHVELIFVCRRQWAKLFSKMALHASCASMGWTVTLGPSLVLLLRCKNINVRICLTFFSGNLSSLFSCCGCSVYCSGNLSSLFSCSGCSILSSGNLSSLFEIIIRSKLSIILAVNKEVTIVQKSVLWSTDYILVLLEWRLKQIVLRNCVQFIEGYITLL